MPTETVTVLFTDLVGSTELLSRVGEVRADSLRREHFGLLRTAISDAGGREVKNLGDGLMVAFDGVTAALACAVAMQQAIAARPPDLVPVAIRIGVAVGEAELEDGDYFGLPVVEAARLCARADGGEILTTGFVRMLARSRSGFDLELVGDLELKGLDEPVETYRVGWAPLAESAASAVPIPKRIVQLVNPGFVGRAAERTVLDAAHKSMRQGERRAVFIGGEPGIGKTTLTAGFASHAAASGAWVLYGRCDEDLFVPYQPWVEALDHLVTHAPRELLVDHVEARGHVLTRLLPALATRTGSAPSPAPSSDSEADLHLLLGAVVDLLDRAAATEPVIVVLDDLHWADTPSVQFLRHVVVKAAGSRLMVVGTYRDSEVGHDHPLADALAVLHREPGVERIALRGLADDELLALLERVAGHEMDDDGVALRDALLRETAGNPFFVGEMLRHLTESGVIAQDGAGRWMSDTDVADAGLPVSIKEVVGRRVSRLGSDAVPVLAMAAVIGREFDVTLLDAVVELAAEAVVDVCDTAVDAHILRETGVPERYGFAHALIAHALYDDLSTSRRTRAHRAVAAALEQHYGDQVDDHVGELAYHWAKATRPDDAKKAIEYACRAGDRALATLAPEEARRWYEDALALLDEPATRTRTGLEIRVGLGEAQKLAGDSSYLDTLVVVARDAFEQDETELAVRAALASNRGAYTAAGHFNEDYAGILRTALELVGTDDTPERAKLLAAFAAELTWQPGADPDVRVLLADNAIEIARRIGDDALFAEVVAVSHLTRVLPETSERRWLDETDAIAAATRTGDPVLTVRTHWARAFTAIERGDRDAFDEHVRTLVAVADRLAVPLFSWMAAMHEAELPWFDGEAEETRRAARHVVQLGFESGHSDAIVVAAGHLLNGEWISGRFESFIPSIEAGRAADPELAVYASALAWAHARDGDADIARSLLADDLAREFPAPRGVVWLGVQALWANVAYLLDDAASAALLGARLEPWSHLVPAFASSHLPAVTYYAGLARAVTGDLDLAVAHLEAATATHRRLRAPFFVACSETALAEVLHRRGHDADRERAASLAATNLAVARERGYPYVERDARAVLAASTEGRSEDD